MKVHKYGLPIPSTSHADESPLAAQETAASFVHEDFRGIFVGPFLYILGHVTHAK
jgi:hypothetical protein